MRAADSNSRSAFLSTVTTPEWQIIARRMQVDFGGSPLVESSDGGIITGDRAGDDWFGEQVWGDSCVTASSGYLLRLINKAAAEQVSDFRASWTTDGANASDWDYTDISNGSITVSDLCRIGVYPKSSSDNVYVWYMTAGYLYRAELNFLTETWSGATPAFDASFGHGFDAVAIHPISESEAFVVGFVDHWIWVRYCKYSGGWGGSGWFRYTWSSPDIRPVHVHYSDAALVPGESAKSVILLNLGKHGATHSIFYNSDTDVYSMPTIVAGGAAEWAGFRVLVTGISTHNNRLWGVFQRSLEASDECPQAFHVMVMSSPDGLSWRDEDFVGIAPCRGKLLYNSGDNYCYVAGNAAVYKGSATYKLGSDLAAMKREIVEAGMVRINTSQANSPGELVLQLIDVDDDILTDVTLQPWCEVTVSIRESGEVYTDIYKGYIDDVEIVEGYGKRPGTIRCHGSISRLVGPDAWHHPTGHLFEGPEPFYSNFNFDKSGQARITVKQETGTWIATYNHNRGLYELAGKEGMAVIPRAFHMPTFTIKSKIRIDGYLDAARLIFFWEDSENFWQAGIRRDLGTTTHYADIWRCDNGTWVKKDEVYISSISDGDEVLLYVDARPGYVRFYLKQATGELSDEDMHVSNPGCYALSADLTSETEPLPIPHHIGVKARDYEDDEEVVFGSAIKSGVVDSYESEYVGPYSISNGIIEDQDGGFDDTDIGKHLYIDGEWREITAREGSTHLRFVPALGSDASRKPYGIYASQSNIAEVRFIDFAACDGRRAWSVDEIATSILEQAGVSRDETAETVYPIGHASAKVYYDVDITVTGHDPAELYIHASRTTNPNAWKVSVAQQWTSLYKSYMNDSDVWTEDLVARYPNMVWPEDIADSSVRFVHRENTLYIYIDGSLACAFWDVRTSGSGYTGMPGSSNTAETSEFPRMLEAFILDADQSTSMALANLLRGRPALMVERADGSVALSKFDTHDDLGAWSTSVEETAKGTILSPALIESEGADVRQYFLDKENARNRLIFRKARNESAEGELQTLREAVRVAKLAQERAGKFSAKMPLPDIAAELEDQVEIEGNDYIIEGIRVAGGFARGKPAWVTEYRLRSAIATKTIGEWHTGSGSSTWGSVHWG